MTKYADDGKWPTSSDDPRLEGLRSGQLYHGPTMARPVQRDPREPGITIGEFFAAEPLSEADVAALNPGVRRLVPFLRANGFDTRDSGDGATHEYACDRSEAYVVCAVEPRHMVAEADRLAEVLRVAGVKLAPLTAAGVTEGAYIQANYSPCDRFTFIDLTGVTDADLASGSGEGSAAP